MRIISLTILILIVNGNALAINGCKHLVLEGVSVVPFSANSFNDFLKSLSETKDLKPKKPDFSTATMTLMVQGHQWYWSYSYLEGIGKGIKFNSTSDAYRIALYKKLESERKNGSKLTPFKTNAMRKVENMLVIPVNTNIEFLVTSQKVIHSVSVPGLGLKRDAIPGHINRVLVRAVKLGVFQGQCTELCGMHHAYMPIVIKVVSKSEYASWVKTKMP